MQRKHLLFILLIIINNNCIYSQNKAPTDTLKELYKIFNYKGIIEQANLLLNKKDSLNNKDLEDVFLYKGIAHYSLLQDSLADSSFSHLININPAYVPDSALISPKIISFFNSIKLRFPQEQEIQLVKPMPNLKMLGSYDILPYIKFQRSVIKRSLVFPGWGHIYMGQKFKGWILSSLAFGSLGTFTYFYIDADKKEKAYKNEVNLNIINLKYDRYNKSYKIRNYAFLAYALVWVYAQFDLLFVKDLMDYYIAARAETVDKNALLKIRIPIN